MTQDGNDKRKMMALKVGRMSMSEPNFIQIYSWSTSKPGKIRKRKMVMNLQSETEADKTSLRNRLIKQLNTKHEGRPPVGPKIKPQISKKKRLTLKQSHEVGSICQLTR